ncbi:Hypothetical predicted protein [Mytilus galloprovincialis]|uniref:Integrase catalytic domain-containing protein n=1 Tax=Mytilus galloprovincialis TaxID=29158 RepID=A0A8B6FVW8_MYTGA|nr:Hypothetical predicted protein [Mytilus galloprovincialis]
MGNGMCERFNRTLLEMLGSLEPHQKAAWKDYVATLVHAYNCARHDSTGQTPYPLMFGRNPRLPIDVVFCLRENEKEPSSKYIKELRHRITQAHELATAAADNARTKQGKAYNTKVRGGTIKPGDRVLNTETGGDTQSSEDTISVDEDLISEDERSASQDEIVEEDTLEQDTSHTYTDDEDEPVPIRRSVRERRPPLRFTTGEFDMAKSATTTMSDWEKKIQCLNIYQTRQLYCNFYRQRQVEPFWIF